MSAQDIVQKWLAILGYGFHPDNNGGDYSPPLPKAMQDAYDADMANLFKVAKDPYLAVLNEMEIAGMVP